MARGTFWAECRPLDVDHRLNPPGVDMGAVTADSTAFLVERLAPRYLGVVTAAVRRHDPHHLLLGMRGAAGLRKLSSIPNVGTVPASRAHDTPGLGNGSIARTVWRGRKRHHAFTASESRLRLRLRSHARYGTSCQDIGTKALGGRGSRGQTLDSILNRTDC